MDIERRHGLSSDSSNDIQPQLTDRFLVAYLPETREGEHVPQKIEFAFTPTMHDAVDLLRRVVRDSDHGWGAAAYVHDLHTGVSDADFGLH